MFTLHFRSAYSVCGLHNESLSTWFIVLKSSNRERITVLLYRRGGGGVGEGGGGEGREGELNVTYRQTYRASDEAGLRGAFAPKNAQLIQQAQFPQQAHFPQQ